MKILTPTERSPELVRVLGESDEAAMGEKALHEPDDPGAQAATPMTVVYLKEGNFNCIGT